MAKTTRRAFAVLCLVLWLSPLLNVSARSDPESSVESVVVFVTCRGGPSLRGSVQLTTTDRDGDERRLGSSCNIESRRSTEHELTTRGEPAWDARVTVRGSSGSRTCEGHGPGLPIFVRCELDGDAVELESRRGVSTADVPPLAECRTPPRDLDSLLALTETPAGGDASPVETILSEGEPADEATVSEMRTTMRELLACYNAGDYLRAFSLYTDDYFRRLFADSGPYHPDVIALLAKPPMPRPAEERLALVEALDARSLPDGRVSAVVVIDDPTVPGPEPPALIVFARAGERWLIGETLPIGRDQVGAG